MCLKTTNRVSEKIDIAILIFNLFAKLVNLVLQDMVKFGCLTHSDLGSPHSLSVSLNTANLQLISESRSKSPQKDPFLWSIFSSTEGFAVI